jgi:hypothetical protein
MDAYNGADAVKRLLRDLCAEISLAALGNAPAKE